MNQFMNKLVTLFKSTYKLFLINLFNKKVKKVK